MNNTELTNDEVLELAREAGFNPSLLSDRFIKLNELITAKLQEKSQGEAIGYVDADNLEVAKYMKGKYTFVISNSKEYPFDTELYLHPAPPQPQTVKDALEMAIANIKQCRQPIVYPDENQASISCYHEGLDKACQVIRALIDQPAEQPAQSQELTDAQIIKAAYQARIIDANHDWVGRLEANTMIHLRHFVDMLALQSKPAKG